MGQMSEMVSDEVRQLMADLGNLVANNQTVESLRSGLRAGANGFKLIPMTLDDVIEEDAWQDRVEANGTRFTFSAHEFVRFITDPEPAGLATPLDTIRRYLGESDNPLRIKFEQLVARKQGPPPGNQNATKKEETETNPNNIRVCFEEDTDPPVTLPLRPRDRIREPQAGTSLGYAVRRLTKERPDLLARVEAGEMTAHAAMVEAGFRDKAITIDADPAKAAKRLARHFEGDKLRELVRLLVEQIEAMESSP